MILLIFSSPLFSFGGTLQHCCKHDRNRAYLAYTLFVNDRNVSKRQGLWRRRPALFTFTDLVLVLHDRVHIPVTLIDSTASPDMPGTLVRRLTFLFVFATRPDRDVLYLFFTMTS